MKKKRPSSSNTLQELEASHHQRPSQDALIAKRLHLMEEIARLRNWNGTALKPLERAELLLTTRWGRATWAMRASLLKSAQWLVGLAYSQGTLL